ncbi:MAG: hypothetical protein IJP65_02050, partial [Bacteroidales bacterium]|nr:hypothetical protein [Bacteroidales bacterium]
MKKLLSFFVLFFMGLLVFAQAPQKFDVMFILQAKKINICSNSQIAGSILGSYRRTLSEVSYICST